MSTQPNHEFRSDNYDDPNRHYVCGASADGLPCPLGPSHRGECRAVCTPRREGDRYYCNNASELAGVCDEGPSSDGECCQIPPQCAPTKLSGQWVCNRGKCQEGPLPDGTCNMKFGACRPVRGVLARRRLAVYIGLGLAVGGLLMLTGSPRRQAAVSPGRLASHHQTANDCKDCHTAGEGNLVDWVHAAFAASADSGQSNLCLKCHAELGENAKFAHSLAPASLAERTESIDPSQESHSQPFMLTVARRGRPTPEQELACATCHEEHRGRDFDMTQMGDLQCQVCHAQTFKSFSRGHPDFASYPYTRRTQIHFNHQTHYQLHFGNCESIPPAGTPLTNEQGQFDASSSTCAHCHVPDEAGKTMLLRGFDQSCGGCHSEQISDLRLQVVSIPKSSFASHASANPNEDSNERSAWSEKYETGIMRLLLARDPEIGAARDLLLNSRWSLQSDDDARTVVYQPHGHADVLLKRWLETAASHSTANSATAYARGESVSPWEQVFAELSGLASPGRCMKCHTANERADNRLQIEWAARRRDSDVRGFTDFVHAPHLPRGEDGDCTSCHRLTESDSVVLFKPEFVHPENAVNTNPEAVETSGFDRLQINVCAACHQRTMSGDNCLTCHKYHVNSLDHVVNRQLK